MFSCNCNNRIYVVCPAGGRTGGLELLHQLVYSLNLNGVNAKIAYTKINKDKPAINPAYEIYVKDYIRFEYIEDTEENIVIISEHRVELMNNFKRARVAIWWLSVDNYLKVYDPKYAFKHLGWKGIAWYLKNRRWSYRVSKINNRISFNLAQSYYAIDYLHANGFRNIEYLSDYISKSYLDADINTSIERQDVVLYNPKKGLEFSKHLMSLDSSIKWIPLIDLSSEQVRALLLSSKVYIDFGNHPGKDRFPREAAFCGCCVITGKRGSANFYKDVMFPDTFKFEDKKENGTEIINCIKKCFANYNACNMEFSEYRHMIAKEYKQFDDDVKKIFLE